MTLNLIVISENDKKKKKNNAGTTTYIGNIMDMVFTILSIN